AAAHREKVKLFMGVLALQFLLAGFHIVSRAALNMGISKLVFIVYRNVISLALLAPFAYFLEKKDRPPLTFSLLAEFFVLALIGITANQGFYLLGLYHLSPTYASAIQNMVPAITFVLATVLRLEQVDLGRRHGVAKVVGTVVPVLKRYPARLSVISLTCVFGLLQFLVIAAFTEEDLSRWKVQSGGELFTILYAGLVASGVAFALQIWCIDRGGPLFTAVFQPVQTVAVAVMAAVILGDQLYTGGIIGAVLIVIGLYFVLWGKSEEKKTRSQDPEMARHLLGEDGGAADKDQQV
uniref:WAT1-related protein n=1 Tax=Aegilops tauschii subsp. strangulata TaxID=200361 RepID=A0A453DS30_AEGTS